MMYRQPTMKHITLSTIAIIALLTVSGYLLYRHYMKDLIADVIVSESLTDYIPGRIKNRIDAIKKPFNGAANAMLQEMHASRISMDDVLEVVDNTTEEEAYAFLDELNETKPATTNEVFDIAKNHFKANFDVEIFRKPFNEHMEMKHIRKLIAYANHNRKSNDLDVDMARTVLKKILTEKEQEFIKTSAQ